jgi:eukaryotic-like serine/threonine-protein kinase
MVSSLQIDYAVQSSTGNKEENADAADIRIPEGSALLRKGIAAVIADGMSSSEGGKQAAKVCVKGFLNDYFSTPDSWTVKTSATKIIGALNQWLFSQGQMVFDSARGMVTTFSGLVIKSSTAFLFHVGDTRIYQFRQNELIQITRDHRVWVSKDKDFLSRAMGIDAHVDVDCHVVDVEVDDMFLMLTDGISGHVTKIRLQQLLNENLDNLESCSLSIMEEALHNGSMDNVTCQLIKVLSLPTQNEDDILHRITELPFPPDLHAGMTIDNYRIVKEMYVSNRSEVFLAEDTLLGNQVVLKTPSINFKEDPAYLEGFLHEEWIGKRINSPHVLKALETPKKRFLYHVTEYIRGQSLRQWIHDHPQTHMNKCRDFLRQISEGLRAFHRLEMLHLDLKPENILIDEDGCLKIIDFGSTRVAGVAEIAVSYDRAYEESNAHAGTLNYSSPESMNGVCTERADIFSFGVIAYELLTGELPYVARDHIIPAKRLQYRSARLFNDQIAHWVDEALKKSVHPDPELRYNSISEFLYDLKEPNEKFVKLTQKPLIERNPLLFWKGMSLLLFAVNFLTIVLLL